MKFALKNLSFSTSLFVRTFLSLLFVLGSQFLSAQPSQPELGLANGLRPVLGHEIEHIERNWHKVAEVKPNKLGAERINDHLASNGHDPVVIPVASTIGEEVTLHHGTIESLQVTLSTTPLPSSVDNSTRVSFPPIGDQKQLGSCVAWGSTYYQATHELGLLNGYNNKASFEHVLSPKWTYNLLNDGVDGGLNVLSAYDLLSQNGATSIINFPYDSNFLAWDLKEQDWITAISNRFTPPQLVTGIGGSSQNLTLIKQLLTNGHVLTMATFVDSWVFTQVKADPLNPQSPYLNQYAASWMNGQNGGHCMTIVGYDDNLWIDINGNGQVDAGERGAFLVANSWGNWGNGGFIWVAYDAFLAVSAVPNGPSVDRAPLAGALNNYVVSIVPKAANYSPKLITTFSLNQIKRNQISIAGGVSSTTLTSPLTLFKSSALSFGGGAYEFDGSSSTVPETGIFALDLTDLLPANLNTIQRYYLVVDDDAAGNPTMLNSFNLLDYVHGREMNYNNSIAIDNREVAPYIDYNIVNNNFVSDTTPPAVTINAPLNGATASGVIQVAITATDNIAVTRVEFYVDDVLKVTDTSAPYSASVDTRTLSNGNHTLTAIAYDFSNNVSHNSVTINVQNSLPVVKRVNVGAGAVTFNNMVWAADPIPSGHSTPWHSPINNVNPIYTTQRFGNFTYTFAVDNGSQSVTLNFAEQYFKSANQRVFNVFINGVKVIDQLDLFKTKGFDVPYDVTIPVNVTNGQIKIDFVPTINNAVVNGIEITKV